MIDALDECPEDEERPKILRFLTEVMKELPLVRVFITSRREADITYTLESRGTPTIQLEARNMAADIEKYVSNKIERLQSGLDGRKLYVKDECLVQKIIATLTNRADGMFLWVDLQLRQLCKASARRRDEYVEQALDKLPSGLDATYRRILEQIQSYDDHMKDLAFNCLMWVFYAQRPLTMAELQHAIVVIDTHIASRNSGPVAEDEEAILSACANLVEKGPEGVVRPIHYSVKEFFTDPAQAASGMPVYINRVSHIHQKLAEACINELQLRLSSGPSTYWYDLKRCIEKAPFVWYAAHHFDGHLLEAGDLSEESMHKLNGFLSLGDGFIAAVQQLRAVNGYPSNQYFPDTYQNFVHLRPADSISLVFSSQLFHLGCLKDYRQRKNLPKGLIYQAASSGQIKAIRQLIEYGVDVNEKNEMGVGALYPAAANGFVEIAALLASKGADVNAQGGFYGNALQAASSGGREKI
ncbi:uncharacterized protein K452DRAFT_281591, partial [Aplosporella prunicola CBS 121167]